MARDTSSLIRRQALYILILGLLLFATLLALGVAFIKAITGV